MRSSGPYTAQICCVCAIRHSIKSQKKSYKTQVFWLRIGTRQRKKTEGGEKCAKKTENVQENDDDNNDYVVKKKKKSLARKVLRWNRIEKKLWCEMLVARCSDAKDSRKVCMSVKRSRMVLRGERAEANYSKTRTDVTFDVTLA